MSGRNWHLPDAVHGLLNLVIGLVMILAMGVLVPWCIGARDWMSVAAWTLAATMVCGGAVVLIRYRRPRDLQTRAALFAGLLPFAAGVLGAVACGLLAVGQPIPPRPASPDDTWRVCVAIDESASVLYPSCRRGEGGPWSCVGPEVYRHNRLAATVRQACGAIARNVDDMGATRRPDWWQVAAHCFDYQPSTFQQDALKKKQFELAFYSGQGVERIGPLGDGRAMLAAVDRRFQTDQSWEPKPTGLPPELAGLVREKTRQGARTFVIGTGEVDGRQDAEAWKALCNRELASSRPGLAPNHGSAICPLVLPSLPRSGARDLRGSRAKIDLLAALGAAVPLPLFPVSAQPADIRPVPGCFDDLADADLECTDRDRWDTPRDLDELRRKLFGQTRDDREPDLDHASAGLDQEVKQYIDPLRSGEPPRTLAWAGRDLRLLLPAVLCLLLIPIFVLAPRWTLLVEDRLGVPARWERAVLLLATLAGGAALTVTLSHRLWPGREWMQAGRPALAMWGFLSVWSGLVLWPLMYQARGWSARFGRQRHFVAAGLVWSLVWTALLGLGLASQNPFRLAMATGGVLLAAGVVCCLPAGQAGSRASDAQAWTRPWRWCFTATAAAIWAALLLIGFAPRTGSQEPAGLPLRSGVACLLGAAALACILSAGTSLPVLLADLKQSLRGAGSARNTF